MYTEKKKVPRHYQSAVQCSLYAITLQRQVFPSSLAPPPGTVVTWFSSKSLQVYLRGIHTTLFHVLFKVNTATTLSCYFFSWNILQ